MPVESRPGGVPEIRMMLFRHPLILKKDAGRLEKEASTHLLIDLDGKFFEIGESGRPDRDPASWVHDEENQQPTIGSGTATTSR